MKRIIVIGLSIVVIIAVTAGCDTLTPPSTPKASGGTVLSQQNTGIWVTGEGKVTVTPDIALLNLGVEAQADTVAAAQQQAATAMASVVMELGNHDIAPKDIKTRQFNIQQLTRWDNDKQQQIMLGYQVDNIVTAKVRMVEETGNIIDAVARAGGDYIRINSISFTVDNPSAYQKDAREKAMADAQTRAKQLADLSKVRLGKPTYINESGGYAPPPPIIYRAEAAVPAPAPMPTTPVSPGEIEISLNVQVVYSIE
ncbi:SIMPL domain-containing protein [Chloroflexota bacterium]